MLSAILETIRRAGKPMCLADLERELGIEGSALEGMLETLVARGRLRAIAFDGPGCEACPVRGGCFIMDDGVAVTYALPADAVGVPRPTPDRPMDPAWVAEWHGLPVSDS